MRKNLRVNFFLVHRLRRHDINMTYEKNHSKDLEFWRWSVEILAQIRNRPVSATTNRECAQPRLFGGVEIEKRMYQLVT